MLRQDAAAVYGQAGWAGCGCGEMYGEMGRLDAAEVRLAVAGWAGCSSGEAVW